MLGVGGWWRITGIIVGQCAIRQARGEGLPGSGIEEVGEDFVLHYSGQVNRPAGFYAESVIDA